MVPGFGDPCGKALTSHPLVDRISFTGGTETARHVIRNSAENFAQVSLELGGKSPLIIFEDAEIESAVNGVFSVFSAPAGRAAWRHHACCCMMRSTTKCLQESRSERARFVLVIHWMSRVKWAHWRLRPKWTILWLRWQMLKLMGQR
ncbi:MAG: hypothetical protein CM1200mP41_01690 [Gammaproteobacteria bacterium]|nr:MAG: hypothetical protein CM1200mP41_01690 [Gammaproteobacteria bacterium]